MELLESMRSSLPFIFLLIALILCWFAYKQFQFHVLKLPPGPLGLPLLGSVPFILKEPYKEFDRLSKKYGPIISMSLGSYKIVNVSDYEYCKELLSHPAALGRPDKFFDFAPGRGGFAGANGAEWQEQRRLCIKSMRNLGLGKGPWEKLIQEEAAEFVLFLQKCRGCPTDVSGPLTRSAIRNIAELLIGQRFTKNKTNPDLKIIEKAHHVVTEYLRASNPAAWMPWLVKYLVKFNINGYAEKMEVLDNCIDIFRREVTKHQNSPVFADSRDFIGYYIDASNKMCATNTNSYFSVQNLVPHMSVLFFTGSDTTIASVHWLLVLMAAYPEVQNKVHEELDNVIGSDGQAGWDDRKKLPYTMATIFEMQRFAVIVPYYPPRRALETFEFRGFTIPKGTMIVSNSWIMHRDPKYWDNPDEYIPERFLQTGKSCGKNPSKLPGYAPFSFGKRNCPGETVAIMTSFLYFTAIMLKFNIRVPPGLHANLNGIAGGVVHPTKQELCFIER